MIIKSATFDRVNRRSDGSLSMHFTTALEQTSNELKELDEIRGACVIAIKPADFDFKELEALDTVDIAIKEKSSAKRLKSVLWLLQKQELNREPTKEEEKEYYRIKMEAIIQHYKDKLL